MYPDPAGGGGQVPFCQYFAAWWTTTQTFSGTKLNAAPYNQIKPKKPLNPAGWVGYMFPSHNNLWRSELILLDKPVNNAKSKLWQKMEPSSLRDMNLICKGQYASEKRKGLNSCIKILRQVLGLWTYNVAKSAVLKTQADRIGDALDFFDTNMPTIQPSGAKYQKMGLKAEWDQFIKIRTDAVIQKHTKFLDDYSDMLSKHVNSLKSNASPKQIQREQKLSIAIALRPTWTNPFP
ncbi:hypothetical protein EJ04DRAFT_593061 [Polyplosphaeria fusca]|uniref:Uncharacterized protein n=1 Tax=Polyplosphaeria fusca TaxID=682080 RepID=A0A9P4V2I4_9PLEO|nr:hypothetical protein EJ04DRAFT_593061 [Polyplosphaeria fusca]